MRFLTFADLKERKIVENRTTLARWQRQLGFPVGVLFGPNTRRFPESEVEAWLKSRTSQPNDGNAA